MKKKLNYIKTLSKITIKFINNRSIIKSGGIAMRTIIITNAGLARRLLRQGERIIDIKPHRQIKNATVFVFKSTENIRKVLEGKRSRHSN